MRAEQKFEHVVKLAKRDPDVVGLFLGGSRGKGLQTKYSDYDVYIIVKDSKFKECKQKYEAFDSEDFDMIVFSMKDFKEEADFERERWGRYNYVRLKVLIDKHQKIQQMVDEKGRVPEKYEKDFVAVHINDYINRVYRALKCFRDGRGFCARMHSIHSIEPLMDALFAIHGRRIRPYHKYLLWDLKQFPLDQFDMAPRQLARLLRRVAWWPSPRLLKRLLAPSLQLFREAGYSQTLEDTWGNKLDWMLA